MKLTPTVTAGGARYSVNHARYSPRRHVAVICSDHHRSMMAVLRFIIGVTAEIILGLALEAITRLII